VKSLLKVVEELIEEVKENAELRNAVLAAL
jgi:hypothetical protein